MALQRFIKRIVEREIFTPVLEHAGYDPKEADCRLKWGLPETLDYEKLAALLPQLVVLVRDVAAIKPSEIRAILRDVCKLPLEKIERPEFAAEQPVMTVPATEEGVEYIVRRRTCESRGSR